MSRRDHPRPEDFKVAAPIEVRFRDLDGLGHVNNAVFLTYFEMARGHYWKALGLHDWSSLGTYLVARAEVDFRSPVRLSDSLVCHVRVAAIGTRSFRMDYLLVVAGTGRVAALGRTVLVMVDETLGRSVPLSDDMKRMVRRFEGRPLPDPGGDPATGPAA